MSCLETVIEELIENYVEDKFDELEHNVEELQSLFSNVDSKVEDLQNAELRIFEDCTDSFKDMEDDYQHCVDNIERLQDTIASLEEKVALMGDCWRIGEKQGE